MTTKARLHSLLTHAHNSMLLIWPGGRNCEHQHARSVFADIEDALKINETQVPEQPKPRPDSPYAP